LYSAEDELIEVVAFKDLDNYWVVKRRGQPRIEDAQRSKGGCVAVALVISPDGKTSAHKVVGSFPDHALDAMAINAWKKTHFEPAEGNKNKTSVYTVMTTVLFGVNGRVTKVSREEEELAIKVRDICRQKADKYLTELVHMQESPQ